MTQSQIARLFGVLCQPSTAIFVQSTRRSKWASIVPIVLPNVEISTIWQWLPLYRFGCAPWNPKPFENGCFTVHSARWLSCKSMQTIDKGKLILHTTVNKKSKSIFLELFFLLQSMALNAIHALLSDLQGESNPPVGIACQTQRSAVELHDLPRKAQPDARAVGLGRVEGGKDIFGDLGRDRSPVVVELDDNSLRRGWTQASRRTILYRTQAPCENPVPRRKAMIVTRLRNDESNPMTDYFPAKAWALWLGDSPTTRATYSPRYAYAANMPETAYLSEINDEYEYRGNLGKPRLVPWREQLQRVNHSESSYLWSRTDFGITTAPQATRQISASKRTPPKPRTSKLLSRESLLSWFTWGSPSSYSVIPVR